MKSRITNKQPKSKHESRLVTFWRELRNPALKCKRVGHKDVTDRVKIRRESRERGEVVADYMADITKCSRCGRELPPENEEKVDWFNRCSMPSPMWDEMRGNGFVKV